MTDVINWLGLFEQWTNAEILICFFLFFLFGYSIGKSVGEQSK